jgi:hypothetical protein
VTRRRGLGAAQAVLLTVPGISHAKLSAIPETRRPVRRARAPRHAAARHRAIVNEVALDVPFLGASRYRRGCTCPYASQRVFWRAYK